MQIMAELDQNYEVEQAHEQEYDPEQEVVLEHENAVEHAHGNEVELVHGNEVLGHKNEVELAHVNEVELAHEIEVEHAPEIEVEHVNEEVEHVYEDEVKHIHEDEVGHANENEKENEPEDVIPEDSHPDVKQNHADEPVSGVIDKWPGWPGESIFRMLVPAQKVGSIIGRKGEYIKKTCEETKARIKILDGPPGTRERAVRKFLTRFINFRLYIYDRAS